MFPKGAYFELVTTAGPANHIDLHPEIAFRLTSRLSLTANWLFYWRYRYGRRDLRRRRAGACASHRSRPIALRRTGAGADDEVFRSVDTVPLLVAGELTCQTTRFQKFITWPRALEILSGIIQPRLLL